MIRIDRVIVDTSALVALVRDWESANVACLATLTELRVPLLTCWPVLTEAAWLLRKDVGGIAAIATLLDDGFIELVELDDEALHWIIGFMERYRSIRAQLADAALMWLAEREGIDTIFTLDRRDFSVYRTTDGRALRIVPDGLRNHARITPRRFDEGRSSAGLQSRWQPAGPERSRLAPGCCQRRTPDRSVRARGHRCPPIGMTPDRRTRTGPVEAKCPSSGRGNPIPPRNGSRRTARRQSGSETRPHRLTGNWASMIPPSDGSPSSWSVAARADLTPRTSGAGWHGPASGA